MKIQKNFGLALCVVGCLSNVLGCLNTPLSVQHDIISFTWYYRILQVQGVQDKIMQKDEYE